MKNKWRALVFICSMFLTICMMGCGGITMENPTEKYPKKPITVLVPFSAGGSMDLMIRAMENEASQQLGQSLIVINKPGGAGTICWNELSASKADGYTIGAIGVATVLQPLYNQTKYNYPTALEPLAQIATVPVVVVAHADDPWNNLDDLIKYAKQHPGEIKYGHSGIGAVPHLIGEMFAQSAGIKIEQVPFRGGAESLTAFLGGHIQLLFITTPEVKEYVKNGQIKVLAVAESKRLADSPFANTPTFKEQGIDLVFSIWQGVAVPKGLSADIKYKLAEGLKDIILDPDYQKRMKALGMNVEYLGPQEFGSKWVSESERLSAIIKETGIAERIASQKK